MKVHPRSVLLLALALAACGTDRPADGADRTLPAAADSSRAAAEPAPVPAAPASDRPARTVTLAADRLELGAADRLPFGAARTRVLAAVGGVLGEPVEQGMAEECPAGPLYQVSYADGLQLSFRDSAFVGWFAQPGSPLRTEPGIGPGSRLGQLRSAYPGTTVEETSLGYEFAAGELYGIVTDTSDTGVVEVVFAGINCIFR